MGTRHPITGEAGLIYVVLQRQALPKQILRQLAAKDAYQMKDSQVKIEPESKS
jgi:hypothetical protein